MAEPTQDIFLARPNDIDALRAHFDQSKAEGLQIVHLHALTRDTATGFSL